MLMEILKDIAVNVEKSRVAAILKCGKDMQDEMRELINNEYKSCLPLLAPLIVLEKVNITAIKDNCVCLENGVVFKGEYIAKKLAGCKYIIATVCTVGQEIGDYISGLFKEDKMLEGMVADSIAVAAVENLGSQLWSILVSRISGTKFGMTQRLSPGDGGWHINEQRKLFGCFPQNGLPIALSENNVMMPLKSLSAVYGFGEGIGISRSNHVCSECSLKKCPYRITDEYNILVNTGESKTIVKAKNGNNLLTVLQKNKLIGDFPCSGNGTCGKCRVKVISGATEVTEADKVNLTPDEIAEGYRISCRLKVSSQMEISVQNLSQDFSIMAEGINSETEIDSPVKKCHLVFEKHDTNDKRSDLKRISDGMGIDKLSASPAVLRSLSEKIRTAGYDFTATAYNNILIDIENGDTCSKKYGVAVDIGTTTVVCYLVDLLNGKIVDKEAGTNSQRTYGADVISRIDFTDKNADGTQTLRSLIVNQINSMVDCLCSRNGIKHQNIYEMTVTGNTVMLHFLLGLPTKNIAVAPFTPVITEAVEYKSTDIGININGIVSIMPGIASYVGSDITAGILACGIMETEKYSLLIDLGTNGEMALGNSYGITACAVAAGPAFEGGNIKCGIGGIKGAICGVDLDKADICKTIGNAEACGICGSGVLDAVSELLKNNIIDFTGRFADKESINNATLNERLIEDESGSQFVLAKSSQQNQSIVVTQKDVREIQLAKAAVAAGIQMLLKESGIKFENIYKVYIAGGFGNYMNIKSALNIGLIPPELKDKIVSAGNTAGVGAKLYLLSRKHREQAEKIVSRTSYIELSNKPEFQDFYIDAMTFE